MNRPTSPRWFGWSVLVLLSGYVSQTETFRLDLHPNMCTKLTTTFPHHHVKHDGVTFDCRSTTVRSVMAISILASYKHECKKTSPSKLFLDLVYVVDACCKVENSGIKHQYMCESSPPNPNSTLAPTTSPTFSSPTSSPTLSPLPAFINIKPCEDAFFCYFEKNVCEIEQYAESCRIKCGRCTPPNTTTISPTQISTTYFVSTSSLAKSSSAISTEPVVTTSQPNTSSTSNVNPSVTTSPGVTTVDPSTGPVVTTRPSNISTTRTEPVMTTSPSNLSTTRTEPVMTTNPSNISTTADVTTVVPSTEPVVTTSPSNTEPANLSTTPDVTTVVTSTKSVVTTSPSNISTASQRPSGPTSPDVTPAPLHNSTVTPTATTTTTITTTTNTSTTSITPKTQTTSTTTTKTNTILRPGTPHWFTETTTGTPPYIPNDIIIITPAPNPSFLDGFFGSKTGIMVIVVTVVGLSIIVFVTVSMAGKAARNKKRKVDWQQHSASTVFNPMHSLPTHHADGDGSESPSHPMIKSEQSNAHSGDHDHDGDGSASRKFGAEPKSASEFDSEPSNTVFTLLKTLGIHTRVWPIFKKDFITDLATLKDLTKEDFRQLGMLIGDISILMRNLSRVDGEGSTTSTSSSHEDQKMAKLTQGAAKAVYGRLEIAPKHRDQCKAILRRIANGVDADTVAHPCFLIQRGCLASTTQFQVQIEGVRLHAQKAIYLAYNRSTAAAMGSRQVVQTCLYHDNNWWCLEPSHIAKCAKKQVARNMVKHPIPGPPHALLPLKRQGKQQQQLLQQQQQQQQQQQRQQQQQHDFVVKEENEDNEQLEHQQKKKKTALSSTSSQQLQQQQHHQLQLQQQQQQRQQQHQQQLQLQQQQQLQLQLQLQQLQQGSQTNTNVTAAQILQQSKHRQQSSPITSPIMSAVATATTTTPTITPPTSTTTTATTTATTAAQLLQDQLQAAETDPSKRTPQQAFLLRMNPIARRAHQLTQQQLLQPQHFRELDIGKANLAQRVNPISGSLAVADVRPIQLPNAFKTHSHGSRASSSSTIDNSNSNSNSNSSTHYSNRSNFRIKSDPTLNNHTNTNININSNSNNNNINTLASPSLAPYLPQFDFGGSLHTNNNSDYFATRSDRSNLHHRGNDSLMRGFDNYMVPDYDLAEATLFLADSPGLASTVSEEDSSDNNTPNSPSSGSDDNNNRDMHSVLYDIPLINTITDDDLADPVSRLHDVLSADDLLDNASDLFDLSSVC